MNRQFQKSTWLGQKIWKFYLAGNERFTNVSLGILMDLKKPTELSRNM